MTMGETPTPSQPDDRLEQILADYLHAVEAGTAPDRAERLQQHPDLAANRDAMERIAAPIKDQLLALPAIIGPSELLIGSEQRR
jgi:2-oxo-4-hydroxy-4-carboxy--5-ureidoimidazoline (OHCU) decarboxylase